MNGKLTVLLIEDNPGDTRLIQEMLAEASGVTFELECAHRLSTGLERLAEGGIDVVLLDLGLPDSQGLDTFDKVYAHAQIPAIVLSGLDDESLAVEAVQRGAQDYLIKGQIDSNPLARAIRYAVERRRMAEALQQRNRELTLLHRAGQALSSSLDLDQVLDTVLEEVRRLLDVVACSVWLNDPATGELVCQQVIGPQSEIVRGWRLAPGEGLAGWVACHGESLIVPDTRADERHFEGVDERTGLKLHSILCVPLQVKQNILGVLQIVDEKVNRFDATELTLIEPLAASAASAIENARLLEKTRQQAQQVQHIISTVPEGVLLLDTDLRVLLANPAARKYLSILVGRDAISTHESLTRLGDRPLTELLTSPPKGLWHEVMAGNRSFELVARPMEAGPENEGWVLVIRDITDEKEIQQRAQQQERLAAVGQLAAGIAHDFNNIMAVIVLYGQMALRDPDLPPKLRERLTTIDKQAKHATDLIQQILDFSRRAVLERQPMTLVPFLKEQVKLLERTLPESIKIALDYGPDEYTVNADPTRMQQMIMNLAVNARDAMPGGGQLRLGLELIRIKDSKRAPLPEMKVGEWVRVTVADTGTGIPPDVLPRIFEPFFTTKAPLGSGLGLAQVYGIVKQHNGHIDVTTKVGEGTTFIIYLPALPVERPGTTLPLETSGLVEGHGETILVVEDDPITREALVDSLELLNYRPLEAANGREAIVVFEQRGDEIDLVLSDLVMPEMGGRALFHTLRQKNPAVRVVVLTGYPLGEEIKELQAQGIAGWIQKPPSLEQLAEVIGRGLKTTT